MMDPDRKAIRKAYRIATGKVGKRLTATDERIIEAYITSRLFALLCVILSSKQRTAALIDAIKDPYAILEHINLDRPAPRYPKPDEISGYQAYLVMDMNRFFGRGDA